MRSDLSLALIMPWLIIPPCLSRAPNSRPAAIASLRSLKAAACSIVCVALSVLTLSTPVRVVSFEKSCCKKSAILRICFSPKTACWIRTCWSLFIFWSDWMKEKKASPVSFSSKNWRTAGALTEFGSFRASATVVWNFVINRYRLSGSSPAALARVTSFASLPVEVLNWEALVARSSEVFKIRSIDSCTSLRGFKNLSTSAIAMPARPAPLKTVNRPLPKPFASFVKRPCRFRSIALRSFSSSFGMILRTSLNIGGLVKSKVHALLECQIWLACKDSANINREIFQFFFSLSVIRSILIFEISKPTAVITSTSSSGPRLFKFSAV